MNDGTNSSEKSCIRTDMDNRIQAKLELIKALEDDYRQSQAKLAKRLGIAVGLVNILMRRAVKQGLIRVKQVPARRFAYFLTPKGFAEKATLVVRYLDSSLNLYRKLRLEYRDIFTALKAKNVHEVTLVGNIDIAELAIMAAFDSNVRITALVNNESDKDAIGSVPIVARLSDASNGPIVVCDARAPQACFDELLFDVDQADIYFPQAFYITISSLCADDEAA